MPDPWSKQMIDPRTGAVDESVWKERNADNLLQTEIAGGGDGGMGDNLNTKCQEKVRRLTDRLYSDM